MANDENVGMALFYANQKVSHRPAPDALLTVPGESYYIRNCRSCHGESGHGKRQLPRISGQQPAYLHTALKRYRDGTGVRLDARMAANTKKMTDAAIDALVA